MNLNGFRCFTNCNSHSLVIRSVILRSLPGQPSPMNKILFATLCFWFHSVAFAQQDLGPFFEPGFPFYQTQVDLTDTPDSPPDNFVVRGIVLPLGEEHVIAFDQDLLRGRSQAQHIDDEQHARCHKAEVTRGEWRLYGVSIVPG